MLMSWTGLVVLIARPGTDREHLGDALNTRVRMSTTTEQRLTVTSGSHLRMEQYFSEQNRECNMFHETQMYCLYPGNTRY